MNIQVVVATLASVVLANVLAISAVTQGVTPAATASIQPFSEAVPQYVTARVPMGEHVDDAPARIEPVAPEWALAAIGYAPPVPPAPVRQVSTPVVTRSPQVAQSVTAARAPPEAPPAAAGARYVPRQQVAAVAAAVGFPSPDYVASIAMCESGLDTNHDGIKDTSDTLATGRAGERGTMQLHPTHARTGGLLSQIGISWDAMYDLWSNMQAAYGLFVAAGYSYSPWSCA